MEISSILLVLAVIVLVGIYVYAPMTQNARKMRAGEKERTREPMLWIIELRCRDDRARTLIGFGNRQVAGADIEQGHEIHWIHLSSCRCPSGVGTTRQPIVHQTGK